MPDGAPYGLDGAVDGKAGVEAAAGGGRIGGWGELELKKGRWRFGFLIISKVDYCHPW